MNHYSPEGKLVAQWGGRGTNAGQLVFPRSAAVNSRGEIYVSEYTTVDRVQKFGPQGIKWLGAFGRSGSQPGEFSRAEGVGLDGQDRLYVADSCNHRIQVFDADGRVLRVYGKAGTGPGELSYPYDVRVDREGRQYVCEFGNSRIQIFGPDDQPMEILGSRGGAPGQFSNPWSIALDSQGNLYVADAMNHRVQKFIRKEPFARTPKPEIRSPKAGLGEQNPEGPSRESAGRDGELGVGGWRWAIGDRPSHVPACAPSLITDHSSLTTRPSSLVPRPSA
jgi:sugar lactone lactonase YvrE